MHRLYHGFPGCFKHRLDTDSNPLSFNHAVSRQWDRISGSSSSVSVSHHNLGVSTVNSTGLLHPIDRWPAMRAMLPKRKCRGLDHHVYFAQHKINKQRDILLLCRYLGHSPGGGLQYRLSRGLECSNHLHSN